MGDVLSQQEIDSLLSGMSSGTIQVDEVINPGGGESKEVMTYDFKRPSRLSKNQLRTFENIHEGFAETFSYYLVSKLQTVVSISLTAVDQLFYSEFILSVSTPSCLYVFDMVGTDGHGILDVSPHLAFAMVERLLGGGADATRKPRAITAIEQAVVQGIMDKCFDELGTAWRSVADLSFKYSRFENEPDFVQIAPGSEIVMVVSFNVTIGTSSFLMTLCFPTFALEDVIAQLNRRQLQGFRGGEEADIKNAEIIKRQIATTYLQVIAELGRARITLQELMDLHEGDVIKLDTKINAELQLVIGGVRKLAARPGTVDGKKAVRVIRKLDDSDIVD